MLERDPYVDEEPYFEAEPLVDEYFDVSVDPTAVFAPEARTVVPAPCRSSGTSVVPLRILMPSEVSGALI